MPVITKSLPSGTRLGYVLRLTSSTVPSCLTLFVSAFCVAVGARTNGIQTWEGSPWLGAGSPLYAIVFTSLLPTMLPDRAGVFGYGAMYCRGCP